MRWPGLRLRKDHPWVFSLTGWTRAGSVGSLAIGNAGVGLSVVAGEACAAGQTARGGADRATRHSATCTGLLPAMRMLGET